jgi:hypothetical protein
MAIASASEDALTRTKQYSCALDTLDIAILPPYANLNRSPTPLVLEVPCRMCVRLFVAE